ncbi:MAG: transcription antitermination factor NusB [Nitrospirae bacterium]|nr:transcription antitermination factor NusB [Nitrospirota bacterium]MBF0535304.1 transcription antitermination factor NusB [Nitrospirota bacterium]MBF0617273.1 transcription antitermination factor NusB [Nitrospirota bacterium]
MTRRQAREYVLQSLFQHEFTGAAPDRGELLNFMKDNPPAKEILEFIDDLLNGTIEHMAELDALIQRACKHWELNRLAAIDRNIMRFAAYEIIFRGDIPNAVSINEAVDIAKRFSTEESFSFINGVLDKIAHQKDEKVPDKRAVKKPSGAVNKRAVKEHRA